MSESYELVIAPGTRVTVDPAALTITLTAAPISGPVPPSEPDPAPAPPPAPTPAPTPTGAVYRTQGRFLYDPQGGRVVVRGVEQRLATTGWLPNSCVSGVAQSAANTIRILPSYREGNSLNLGQIEEAIRLGINGHMLVELAVDGGHDPGIYTDPAIHDLVSRYEPWLALHAMGESTAGDDDGWAAEAIGVVQRLRAVGYKCPLYLMSRHYGRHLPCLLAKGQQVVDADPEHNVVFGWQAYWGIHGGASATSRDGHYQREYRLTLEEAMDHVAAAGFPIQVGLMEHSDPAKSMAEIIPYAQVMAMAQERQVGWLWWDWRGTIPDDLSADGSFGNLYHHGSEIMLDAPYGIGHTSIRTPYQQAQQAP